MNDLLSLTMCGCLGLLAAQTGCSSTPLDVVKNTADASGHPVDSGKTPDAGGHPRDSGKAPDTATSAPDTGGGGASCSSSAECGNGGVCAFEESAGCGARGKCFPVGNCTDQGTPACACDGTTFDRFVCAGLPGGYAVKPMAYAGTCLSCPGPIVDGGVGASCTSTSECGANELCAWPTSQSCSVQTKGVCVAQVEGCHCVPPPACGCDGKAAITGCSAQLPFGYSLSPFAHVGACVADAGADAEVEAGCGTYVLGGPCSPSGLTCPLPACNQAFCAEGQWVEAPLCVMDGGGDTGS